MDGKSSISAMDRKSWHYPTANPEMDMIWRIVLHLLINRTIADNHQMNFPVHAPVRVHFVAAIASFQPFSGMPRLQMAKQRHLRNIQSLRACGLKLLSSTALAIGENLPVCQAMLPERHDIAFPTIKPRRPCPAGIPQYRDKNSPSAHTHAVHGNNVPE